MTRRSVEVAPQRFVVVSPDDHLPLGARTWGIVSAQLIDEITGEPPRGRATVEAREPGLSPRVVGDGLIGVVGIPINLFPALATRDDYVVNLTIRVEGYLPLHKQVPIPKRSTFPADFVPTDLGRLLLHREPVIISGRTMRVKQGATTPLANVKVEIAHIWQKLPPATIGSSGSDPNLVSLRSPLRFPQTHATASIEGVTIAAGPGPDKRLLEDGYRGSSTLKLSNRENISPTPTSSSSDVLLVDALNPDLVEYVTIKRIQGNGTDDQPAKIMLNYPLVNSHRRDAVVRGVKPQAVGTPYQLSQLWEAIAGDTCLFFDSTAGPPNATTIKISGGADAEYHDISLFSVTSNQQGYFRLPPLSRVAQVEIKATTQLPAYVAPPVKFSPDYTSRENRVDFVFRIPPP